MDRRFLYASTVAYNEYVYESASHKDFIEIFALSVLVKKRQKGLLAQKPFSKIYSKLCRDQNASKNVDRHFSLGIWQFYLPIRTRIIKLPATSFELTFLSDRYTSRLNRILPLVDVAIISSDFSLDKICIPNTTKVYLECRSLHKGINSIRPKIELDCPYQNLDEGFGEWELKFEKTKQNFAGFITYSSISAESFRLAGVQDTQIHLAPISVSKTVAKFPASRQAKSLLWIGRGYPSKGLDIAVQISSTLGLSLTVVGALKPNLVKWLRKFPNVIYLGRLDKTLVIQQMLMKEILVMPSVESFGLAVFEALTHGMKVVVSPYVGIIDWVQNHPNLYVSDGHTLPELIEQTINAINSNTVDINYSIPIEEYWRKIISKI